MAYSSKNTNQRSSNQRSSNQRSSNQRSTNPNFNEAAVKDKNTNIGLPSSISCQCCNNGYPQMMIPIQNTTPGGCSSWNGGNLSNCNNAVNFNPRECEGSFSDDDRSDYLDTINLGTEVSSKTLSTTFSREEDYVELHIENVVGQLIYSETNFLDYILNSYLSVISVNPEKILSDRGDI